MAQHLMMLRRPVAAESLMSVCAEFVFPFPKSAPERAGRPHRNKYKAGDTDNLLKPVMDALAEKGWLVDDAQIASNLISKRYANLGEKPKTIITLLA